jgi:hypothetical protein
MKTNDLRFTENRVARNGEQWTISIRLNDECSNGHQDFSLTGACYEAGKRKTERNRIHCGACGDEIAKLFPAYEIFNKLHLCDYKGIPMYCVANGYYHLTRGFERYEDGETLKSKFCKEYRVSGDQFDKLSVAESKAHYAILLEENNIFKQWKEEADAAIKKLEELTGNEFVVDSVKTQYDKPSNREIENEKERLNNGYYSEENKSKRAQEAELKELQKINEEETKNIDKIKIEYVIKRLLFKVSKKAYNNYIYYDHTKQIAFNWRDFDNNKMTDTEIQEVKHALTGKLPKGVTIKQ